jgi:biopolymer transport protein ExbB/TolQ
MAGISEALVATAVGLLVAIPAVVGFNFYNRRVRAHVANVEPGYLAATATVNRHLFGHGAERRPRVTS